MVCGSFGAKDEPILLRNLCFFLNQFHDFGSSGLDVGCTFALVYSDTFRIFQICSSEKTMLRFGSVNAMMYSKK